MTINPSNAGPFGIGLSSELPGNGTRREFNFDTMKAGPQNKAGWLKKIYGEKGGVDYIYIDNGSQYRVSVEASGGKFTEVPSATSIEVTGEGLRHVVLSQNSGNVISANDLTVMVGNNRRKENSNESSGSLQFSGEKAVTDVIPGFSRS